MTSFFTSGTSIISERVPFRCDHFTGAGRALQNNNKIACFQMCFKCEPF
jgi:hypothetical protein